MRQAGSQSAWQARRHAGRRALAPLAWPLAPPRPSTLSARPPPPPPGRPPSTPTRLTAPAPSDRLVAAAAPATQAGTRAATRSRPSSSQTPPPPQTPHRQTPIPLRSRGQRLPSRSGRPDQMGMGPQGGTPSQQDRTPTRHVPPPPARATRPHHSDECHRGATPPLGPYQGAPAAPPTGAPKCQPCSVEQAVAVPSSRRRRRLLPFPAPAQPHYRTRVPLQSYHTATDRRGVSVRYRRSGHPRRALLANPASVGGGSGAEVGG